MAGEVLIQGSRASQSVCRWPMTESGVHSSGFITRDVNGAGALRAVNLPAACEVAEAGNGLRCGF